VSFFSSAEGMFADNEDALLNDIMNSYAGAPQQAPPHLAQLHSHQHHHTSSTAMLRECAERSKFPIFSGLIFFFFFFFLSSTRIT
jgi:hypothetical protein